MRGVRIKIDASTVILSIITVVGTFSSIIFAYLDFHRNINDDNKQAGKSEGVLLNDVGYIKSSIDRIEKTLNKLEEKYDDHIKNFILHRTED